MSKEYLTMVLDTMTVITGLSRTEKETLQEAKEYIENNDNIEFARKIVSMIENDAATTLEDIRRFCVLYIQSNTQEEELED